MHLRAELWFSRLAIDLEVAAVLGTVVVAKIAASVFGKSRNIKSQRRSRTK